MPTATLKALRYAAIDSEYPDQSLTVGNIYQGSDKRFLLIAFDSVPTDLAYKRITEIRFYAYGKGFGNLYVGCLNQTFTEDTTYKNFGGYVSSGQWLNDFEDSAYTADSIFVAKGYWKKAIKHGIIISGVLGNAALISDSSDLRPYLLIEYVDDNVSLEISALTPSSGYVQQSSNNTFSWSTTPTEFSATEPTSTSATIQWRVGENGTVYSVVGNAATASCLLPAGTFPVSENIQWRVVLDVSSGYTVTSDWQTVSTAEVLSTAETLSPKNTYLDASQITEFSWRHIISTDTEQTAWELQISADNSTWSHLVSGSGAETFATIAANTLEAGILYWRIRTYNSDGVAGEWSEPAQVTVIDAPDSPAVRVVNSEPRASVSWQTSGQEGYEILLDGESEGVFWGPTNTWLAPDYLPDGSHVIKVKIQNKYGFWSDWGSAGFFVSNVPGEALTLDGDGGSNAQLEWSGGAYDYYIIYRDDEAIAKTTDTNYTDNLFVKNSRYFIRGCTNDSGYYTESNSINLQYIISNNIISAVDEWNWINLELSTSDNPTERISISRQFTNTNYSEHKYPIAELSEFYGKTLSVSAVFSNGSFNAELFESLLGKVVCYKSISGDSVVGVLGAITKTRTPFWVAYTCNIEQIEWSEVISLDS